MSDMSFPWPTPEPEEVPSRDQILERLTETQVVDWKTESPGPERASLILLLDTGEAVKISALAGGHPGERGAFLSISMSGP